MINPRLYAAVTAIPTAIIDNYLRLASGAALKVILYVLRHAEKGVSQNEIETELSLTSETVCEAFSFWEELGVIVRSTSLYVVNGENLTVESSITNSERDFPPLKHLKKPITQTKKTENENNGNAALEIDDILLTQAKKQELEEAKQNFLPSEITEKINKSKGLRQVFDMAETYFQGKLNAMQCSSLIWMNETLGFSPDCLLLLIDHCSSADKLNWKYIEKLALSWCEKQITTIERIKEETARLKEFYEFASQIKRLFYLSHPLTTNQQIIAEKWRIAGYSNDVMHMAYERTIEKIGRADFKYIDKMLIDWQEHGLVTTAEIEVYIGQNPYSAAAAQKQKQKKQLDAKQRSYDLSPIEEMFK